MWVDRPSENKREALAARVLGPCGWVVDLAPAKDVAIAGVKSQGLHPWLVGTALPGLKERRVERLQCEDALRSAEALSPAGAALASQG